MAADYHALFNTDLRALENMSQNKTDLVSIVQRVVERLKNVDSSTKELASSAKELSLSSVSTSDYLGALDKRLLALESSPKVDSKMLTRLEEMESNIAEESRAIRENTLQDIRQKEGVTSLETSVKALADQNTRLSAMLEGVTKSLSELATNNAALGDRVAFLETSLDTTQKRNNELQSKVDNYWQEILEMREENLRNKSAQEENEKLAKLTQIKRVQRYRLRELQTALKYFLDKLEPPGELQEAEGYEISFLSPIEEARQAAISMYSCFGEENAWAVRNVSPKSSQLAINDCLLVQVGVRSTHACAVSMHTIVGQIDEKAVMSFPGDIESALALSEIGTATKRDEWDAAAKKIDILASFIARWAEEAEKKEVVLHGIIGRSAALQSTLFRVDLESTEKAMNEQNLEKLLAASIVKHSACGDIRVWLWPVNSHVQLQLQSNWASSASGLVINICDTETRVFEDGRPWKDFAGQNITSTRFLGMDSRSLIWKEAQQMVDELTKLNIGRPFKVIFTGLASMWALNLEADVTQSLIGGREQDTDEFFDARITELETAGEPIDDDHTSGNIREVYARLEKSEKRIDEIQKTVPEQEPTLKALMDTSIIESIVADLDIWVQIRTSLEDLGSRVEDGKASADNYNEKLRELEDAFAAIEGNTGRWIDSEQLETIVVAMRRDLKDMHDRGHQVIVDALEELARNKADRKELWKAIKSGTGLTRQNASINFGVEKDIIDGEVKTLHERRGEDPNLNAMLMAGVFRGAESASSQRPHTAERDWHIQQQNRHSSRPKSAGPGRIPVRRPIDPYENEPGTPLVLRTNGPLGVMPTPTTRRTVFAVGGTANSAFLRNGNAKTAKQSNRASDRPVHGGPGQARPSSPNVQVVVPNIGRSLSSTAVALAASDLQQEPRKMDEVKRRYWDEGEGAMDDGL